jgi:hypothetical protein
LNFRYNSNEKESFICSCYRIVIKGTFKNICFWHRIYSIKSKITSLASLYEAFCIACIACSISSVDISWYETVQYQSKRITDGIVVKAL